MARSASPTPRKTTSTQAERTAKRLMRQQKQLEKDMLIDMNVKVVASGGRMPKLNDLKKIEPMTDTQSDLFESWNQAASIGTLCYGSAGTGKSFLAMFFALKEILNQDSIYKKLVIIRSTVQARQLGYLKGSEEEKLAVFEQPYINICTELTGNKDAYTKLKEVNKIEFMCTSFLKSLTLSDTIIVCDEMQNTTFTEFSGVLTRLGKNSKILVLGDTKQDDLTFNKNDVSGFRDAIKVMNTMEDFRSFRFTTEDIVRSPFVKSWIVACERMGL